MQNTMDKTRVADLHEAVTDLIALHVKPVIGPRVVKEAGLSLDPALLRILAAIHRFAPIGIVELAERSGRNHTTVSRQVTKLHELGLIERQVSPTDRRVSETVLSAKGRKTAAALLAARERVTGPILAKWSSKDLDDLTRLLRRLVKDLSAVSGAGGGR